MKSILLKLSRSCVVFSFILSSIPLFAQPANDDCEDAIMIELGVPFFSDNTGATPDDIPLVGGFCGDYQVNTVGDEGVFFSFVAPTGPVNIIFMGSSASRLVLLSGTCDTELQCVATIFDGSGTTTLSNLILNAGEIYLVVIDPLAGGGGMFLVESCVNELTCNDVTVTLNEFGVDTISSLDLVMASCDLSGIMASDTVFTLADTIASPLLITVTQGLETCQSSVTVLSSGLPFGWIQSPDGVNCENGSSASYDNNTEIWSISSTNCYAGSSPYTSDQAAFAQYQLCGNGEIIAHVTSITGNALGFAGIVMRESIAAGSKKVQLTTNKSNLGFRAIRAVTGGSAFPQQFPIMNRHWLRLVRTGNQFVGYVSTNGTNWIQVLATNVVMNECLQIGLMVNNYNSNSIVTATFDGVEIVNGNEARGISNELIANTSTKDIIDFKLFPNPSSGEFILTLQNDIDQPFKVDVMNTHGRLVTENLYNEVGESNSIQFNLNNLPSGVYFVRVRMEDGTEQLKRLILHP